MERFHLFALLDYLYLKDFLKYECELYLKQPLTPIECKIIVSIAPQIIDLTLKLNNGQC